MGNPKTAESLDVLATRRKLGLNQSDFWSPIGVTQSAGSRYENFRKMPQQIRELVRLTYVEKIDTKAIKQEDWLVIQYLKTWEPALYESLKVSAREKIGKSTEETAKATRTPRRAG